jgi:hypothetical protein
MSAQAGSAVTPSAIAATDARSSFFMMSPPHVMRVQFRFDAQRG